MLTPRAFSCWSISELLIKPITVFFTLINQSAYLTYFYGFEHYIVGRSHFAFSIIRDGTEGSIRCVCYVMAMQQHRGRVDKVRLSRYGYPGTRFFFSFWAWRSAAALFYSFDFLDDDVIDCHALVMMMSDDWMIFLKPTYLDLCSCKILSQSEHFKIFDDVITWMLGKVDLSNGCYAIQ